MFYKKCVLRNVAKLTGKHLCQSLFFNKVAGLGPANLLKKDSNRCFPVNFAKFLRTPFFTEHLWTAASTFLDLSLGLAVNESFCETFKFYQNYQVILF